jgi:hypothetical protein
MLRLPSTVVPYVPKIMFWATVQNAYVQTFILHEVINVLHLATALSAR